MERRSHLLPWLLCTEFQRSHNKRLGEPLLRAVEQGLSSAKIWACFEHLHWNFYEAWRIRVYRRTPEVAKLLWIAQTVCSKWLPSSSEELLNWENVTKEFITLNIFSIRKVSGIFKRIVGSVSPHVWEFNDPLVPQLIIPEYIRNELQLFWCGNEY